MEKGEARSSLEAWRGDGLGLSLDPEDLELVDNVLYVVPELRIVAFLGREARRRGVEYPVTAEQLATLLHEDVFVLGGQRIDAESVAALPAEWFPLEHEGELLSVIHLGLRRCQAERAAALLDEARKPKNPQK